MCISVISNCLIKNFTGTLISFSYRYTIELFWHEYYYANLKKKPKCSLITTLNVYETTVLVLHFNLTNNQIPIILDYCRTDSSTRITFILYYLYVCPLLLQIYMHVRRFHCIAISFICVTKLLCSPHEFFNLSKKKVSCNNN